MFELKAFACVNVSLSSYIERVSTGHIQVKRTLNVNVQEVFNFKNQIEERNCKNNKITIVVSGVGKRRQNKQLRPNETKNTYQLNAGRSLPHSLHPQGLFLTPHARDVLTRSGWSSQEPSRFLPAKWASRSLPTPGPF